MAKKPPKKAPAKAGAEVANPTEHDDFLHQLLYPEKLQQGVANGEGYWIIEAMLSALVLVQNDDPFPKWLATAALAKLERYGNFEVRTLDEAFGVTRKGMNLAAQRRTLRDIENATFDVAVLHSAGLPIDDGIFDEVGSQYGISRSTMASWWAMSNFRLQKPGYLIEERSRQELDPRLREIFDRIKPR
jgi:hypothetical protein